MKRDEHIVYIVFVKTMFKKWIQVIMKKKENKKKQVDREKQLSLTLLFIHRFFYLIVPRT